MLQVNIPVGGDISYVGTCDIAAGASGNLVNTATVAVPAGDSDPHRRVIIRQQIPIHKLYPVMLR